MGAGEAALLRTALVFEVTDWFCNLRAGEADADEAPPGVLVFHAGFRVPTFVVVSSAEEVAMRLLPGCDIALRAADDRRDI